MNVLFLDIDGVLNSSNWFRVAYETRKASRKKYEDALIADYSNARWELDLSQELVNNLKRIMYKVESLNIVVSSTWRMHYSVDELKDRLSKLLIISPDRIVGKTPRLFEHRGQEIQKWLDDHVVEKFAIVDDDSDMDHLMDHLFKTKNETGLQRDIADKIIEYFNGNE
jgi:hypothetical protein